MHSASAYHTLLPCLPVASEWPAVARTVFRQTFRTQFAEPGFSLVTFAAPLASESLRAAMLTLKQALDALLLASTGRRLVYQSMARFDQQTTTKFHLDGGPAESFLMLGYEASEVPSRLAMADYTLASWRLGIEPAAFVSNHNPMYAANASLLEGTITPLDVFDPGQANLVIINNSCLPYDGTGLQQLGVMHQASIPVPDPKRRRIINSTMLCTAAGLAEEAMTPTQQQEYVTTTHISGPTAY